jgi:Raf kinase inhibitor-like YbhB/YbcL family protein
MKSKLYTISLFVGLLTTGFLLKAFASRLLQPPVSRFPVTANTSVRAKQVAEAFTPFAPMVKTRFDDRAFYVESNGLPAHQMMVGITSWQQQVPMVQAYTGRNAWQFPLTPVPAKEPLSGKTHFFRGAMAIAANGIPIFNALNNRGVDSYQIGELDALGGHCGRADDYHYHIAPTHLQKAVGKDKPIAYALDGYPLYGLTEADGSVPKDLDAFNGHITSKLGYHYHATKTYPYLNGGFHGEVTEIEGQADPQPRAQSVRPATPPLPGAKIVGFEQPKPGAYALTYTLQGQTCKIDYNIQPDGGYHFDYIDAKGTVYPRDYQNRPSRPNEQNRPPRPEDNPPPQEESRAHVPDIVKKVDGFVLRSPVVGADNVLPTEFTGDGSSISPPLAWKGVPKGTKSFVVIMHHIDPQGMLKWYWTLYNIPATTQSLPKDVKDVGTVGSNSVNNRLGYAPPHSKGPGQKTYIITLYALSEDLQITQSANRVDRDVLLTAMKDHVLATSELRVTYTRP